MSPRVFMSLFKNIKLIPTNIWKKSILFYIKISKCILKKGYRFIIGILLGIFPFINEGCVSNDRLVLIENHDVTEWFIPNTFGLRMYWTDRIKNIEEIKDSFLSVINNIYHNSEMDICSVCNWNLSKLDFTTDNICTYCIDRKRCKLIKCKSNGYRITFIHT